MREELFIAFEGIDASGKATQSRMLSNRLNAALYSFPNYDTPMGTLIKSHLQRKWSAVEYNQSSFVDSQLNALLFQGLQLANRLEMMGQMMVDQASGRPIVCDRYALSAEVYGGADGLNVDYLRQTQSYLLQPDLYILLDISVEESFKRRPNRGGDRYEEDRAKLEEVATRYRSLFASRAQDTHPSVYLTVDGSKPADEIHDFIWTHLRHNGYI